MSGQTNDVLRPVRGGRKKHGDEGLCHTGVLGLWPTGFNRTRIVRPQDFVWILLFAGLAIYGPEPQPVTIAVQLLLCLSQILEPKIAFFSSRTGSAISFAIKLVLCYILIGRTDG